MRLWKEVLDELGTWCCASTTLDFKRAQSRFEHEGLSFLTITLPSFGSDFQKSLEEGKVSLDHFRGFKRSGGTPLFLGGFLDRVFDRGTGRLLEDPCVDSIFAIRQLSLMFAKILVPCSEERVQGAIDKYLQCEQDVKEFDRSTPPEFLSDFKRVAVLLYSELFNELDRDVYDMNITPKHGPGSTADRIRGNAKYDIVEWTSRLESVFPVGEMALPNWRFNYLLDRVDILEPGSERPVRVITVPKTLKTPRIIAIEPTCMQYMQQGIMEKMVEGLESSWIRDLIGFSDQIPNQHLAQKGSATGSLATLDLSEASDRVSNQHVRALTHLWPHLSAAIDATRSRKADVPGHGVIRLAKFASMGSALCFPIEAAVFLTVVMMAVEAQNKRQLTRKDVMSMRGKVRIYGDDIIVPADIADPVTQYLGTFGFQVNVGKSYWNGKFRESCGRDYYDGHDVTVTRVRRVFPTRQEDVPETISTVSLRNQLYSAGLWRSAAWLDEKIVSLLGHFPQILPESPVLGRHSVMAEKFPTAMLCGDLHRPLVRGYVVKSRAPLSRATGEGALLKWFLKRSDEPFADRDHLERFGRSDAVNTKLGWAPLS